MPCLDFDIVFSYKMSFTVILDSRKIYGIFGKGKVDQTKSCFHLRYIRIKMTFNDSHPNIATISHILSA